MKKIIYFLLIFTLFFGIVYSTYATVSSQDPKIELEKMHNDTYKNKNNEKICIWRGSMKSKPKKVSAADLCFNIWGLKQPKKSMSARKKWGGSQKCKTRYRGSRSMYARFSDPVEAMTKMIRFLRYCGKKGGGNPSSIPVLRKRCGFAKTDKTGVGQSKVWNKSVKVRGNINLDDPTVLLSLLKSIAKIEQRCKVFPYSTHDMMTAIENELHIFAKAKKSLELADNEYRNAYEDFISKDSSDELGLENVNSTVIANVNDSPVNETQSSTYQFLETLYQSSLKSKNFAVVYSGLKLNNKKIAGLNPSFARCLAAFLYDVKEKNYTPTILDGYRTLSAQQRRFDFYKNKYGLAYAKKYVEMPPERSTHVNGIAADISFKSNKTGDNLALLANRFGLSFSVEYKPNHITPLIEFCGSKEPSPFSDILGDEYFSNKLNIKDISANLNTDTKIEADYVPGSAQNDLNDTNQRNLDSDSEERDKSMVYSVYSNDDYDYKNNTDDNVISSHISNLNNKISTDLFSLNFFNKRDKLMNKINEIKDASNHNEKNMINSLMQHRNKYDSIIALNQQDSDSLSEDNKTQNISLFYKVWLFLLSLLSLK